MEPGTTATKTVPINRFNVRSFITNLEDGAKLIVGRKTLLRGIAVFSEPLQVKVHGSNFGAAMRAFRAIVQKERIIPDYKQRMRYEKPSEKARRKR